MPREKQERPLSDESGRLTPLTPSRRDVKGSPMSNPQRPTAGLTEPLPPLDRQGPDTAAADLHAGSSTAEGTRWGGYCSSAATSFR